MTTYINLTFGTTDGKLHTMRVPRSVDSINPSAVKNAMDALIDADCILTKSGDLFTRERARIVRTTSQAINVS